MIFAFLYGLSMDYEVFMVSRSARDERGGRADVRVLRPLDGTGA